MLEREGRDKWPKVPGGMGVGGIGRKSGRVSPQQGEGHLMPSGENDGANCSYTWWLGMDGGSGFILFYF